MGWLTLAHSENEGVTIGGNIAVIVRAVSPYHHAIVEVVNGKEPSFLYPLIKSPDYLKITPGAFINLNPKQTHMSTNRVKLAYLAPYEVNIKRRHFG